MIKGQTLLAEDGYEVALYPLESIRITQSYNGDYSHGSNIQHNTGLWDVTGVNGDNPKGVIYAPFTGKVFYIGDGHMVFIRSLRKVHYADGTLDYAMFSFAHDNVNDVKVGDIVYQGQKVGDCGDYGYATGVHSHFLLYKGNWPYGINIPVVKNKNGRGIYYAKNNPCDIDNMFFTNKIRTISTTKINGLTLNWKDYEGTTMDLTKYIATRDEYKHQVEITADNVNVRTSPSLSGQKTGLHLPVGIYNVDTTQEADSYTWVKLDTDLWFALVNTAYNDLPATKTIPDLTKYIVERDKTKHQVEVKKEEIRARKSYSTDSEYLNCKVPVGIYNVQGTATDDKYTWIKLDTDIWFAMAGDNVEDLPAESPTDYKTLYELEVAKYNALEKDYKQLGSENATLNSELKSTQEELAAVKLDNTQLQSKLETANADISKLNEKISKAKEVLA